MKKLFLMLLVLISATTIWAQSLTPTPPAVDAKALKARLEKAKASTEHPKRGNKASTWMRYAEILGDAYYAHIRPLYVGQEAAKVVEAMKAPLNADAVPIEKVGDAEYQIYKYENVDVYIGKDEKVAMFIDTNPIYPNALTEFEAALLKALSLDKKLEEKIAPQLKIVVNAYLINMQTHLAFKEYRKAIDNAVRAAYLQKNPAVADKDYLESYYYAAVCAMQGEMFEDSKKYLEILLNNNSLRDGEVYYYLGYIEEKLGNQDRAKKLFEEGVAKFPANQDVMKSLIDIYIRTDEDPSKLIPYIKEAQKGDPKNVALYIAEGVAYENMKQLNKSIDAYKVAVSLDPTSFIAFYNLGYTYSVLSDQVATEINNLITKKNNNVDLDPLYKKMNSYKREAIPFLVKAHELNPKDINTVSLLRSIYFSVREDSKEMLKNFEKFDALFKQLK